MKTIVNKMTKRITMYACHDDKQCIACVVWPNKCGRMVSQTSSSSSSVPRPCTLANLLVTDILAITGYIPAYTEPNFGVNPPCFFQ